VQKIKRLFWDIETSPNVCLSWRTGFKINLDPDNIIKERAIICICYKWEGNKKVYSIEWDRGDDRQLVEDFAVVAAEADELVAHNGDSFDIRWFNGRNALHDLHYKPKTHVGVLNGDGRWTCPMCGGENVIKSKTRVTQMGIKQHQMNCKDCGKYYTISNLVFNQYLNFRYGEAVSEAA
jgi:predicted RNA-binding Zn-ribbon protein involved in translation (DUF1610 family)